MSKNTCPIWVYTYMYTKKNTCVSDTCVCNIYMILFTNVKNSSGKWWNEEECSFCLLYKTHTYSYILCIIYFNECASSARTTSRSKNIYIDICMHKDKNKNKTTHKKNYYSTRRQMYAYVSFFKIIKYIQIHTYLLCKMACINCTDNVRGCILFNKHQILDGCNWNGHQYVEKIYM